VKRYDDKGGPEMNADRNVSKNETPVEDAVNATISARRQTKEQSAATESLRALPGVRASRLRIVSDPEGWPMIPGRYGRMEYTGGDTLAVFTDRPRLVARLLAVPGVRRHQTGDGEARMVP
jgi:hypothetical protein